MHPYVHRSTIHKVKIQKQLKCPSTDEWIRCGTYILMEYFLAIKKNGILELDNNTVKLNFT